LSSAAGHIQPPFACAICILNGEGGRLDPRHFLIDYECLRTRGPHCTSRPPPLSTLAPSYANRKTVARPLPIPARRLPGADHDGDLVLKTHVETRLRLDH
jgi:hypothetical protein